MKKGRVHLGSISTATLRPEDLIPAFADELRRVRGALPRDIARDIRGLRGMDEHDLAMAQPEILQALEDALQDYAPDFCYFGSHPGDGADFGFWLHEDWQQMAEDDDVPMIAAGDPAPDVPRYVEITDHGNATLYARRRNGTFREVWSVV